MLIAKQAERGKSKATSRALNNEFTYTLTETTFISTFKALNPSTQQSYFNTWFDQNHDLATILHYKENEEKANKELKIEKIH